MAENCKADYVQIEWPDSQFYSEFDEYIPGPDNSCFVHVDDLLIKHSKYIEECDCIAIDGIPTTNYYCNSDILELETQDGELYSIPLNQKLMQTETVDFEVRDKDGVEVRLAFYKLCD